LRIPTGEVGFPEGTTYEAEAGSLTGNATVVACSTCSGGKIVTGGESNPFTLSNTSEPPVTLKPVGAGNTVTISNVVGTGTPQWVSFYYINTDDQRKSQSRLPSCVNNPPHPL
jgi:hypothetical protein